MVNKVILIGNLGKAPEVRRLDNGNTVAKFSIATNESWRDKSGEWQTQTEWHDIVVWGKLAEKAETLDKGATLYVEGKLTHRTWEDKDGNKRKTTEVVANYFRVIGGKSDNGSATAQKSQVDDGASWTGDDDPWN
jgi:single-strand DNA-binding protein